MGSVKNHTEQGGERTIIQGELCITETGTFTLHGMEVKPMTPQAHSTASTVVGMVADFNALLAKLQAAGWMKTP